MSPADAKLHLYEMWCYQTVGGNRVVAYLWLTEDDAGRFARDNPHVALRLFSNLAKPK